MLLPNDQHEPVFIDSIVLVSKGEEGNHNDQVESGKQLCDQQHQGNTSLMRAVFNLTKSAIGLGALFLPGNMKRMGLVGGVLMLVLGAVTCSLSLHFLARTSHKHNVSDFFKMAHRVAGGRHASGVALALVLFQFGGLIAYASFVGQYMAGFLSIVVKNRSNNTGGGFFTSPGFLSCVLCAVFIFPLSCMHDMRKIANASIAGMICVFYIFTLTVVDFLVDLGRGRTAGSESITLFRLKSDFLNTFSNMVFAYVNHFTLVSLVPALKNRSWPRRAALIWSSSGIVTAVYVGMGVAGYLHFGNSVTPDILSAPAKPGIAYALGRLAMSLVLIASYPLQCDPTRTASDQLLLEFVNPNSWVSRNPRVRHYAWTLFFVFGPCLIAVTLRAYVMPILEVFSSACGSLLVFILPPYYFLKLVGGGFRWTEMSSKPVSSGDTFNKVHGYERVLAYFNICFGVVVLIGGTVGAVMDMIKKFSSMQ